MTDDLVSMHGNLLTRRSFLWMTSCALAGAASGLFVGCAVNPVTGKSQLMLMSEDSEIQLDRQHSPKQFSQDYGPVQDGTLNAYVDGVGKRVAARTHRPHMPYSFRVVNANYVNAYAFPGGSIAATRGILLKLDDEAQLAALLGHELGHVNARHTAEQMSKGTVVQLLGSALAVAADAASPGLGNLASGVSSLGASALLARYSRDNEYQADALGMEYMVRGGYPPEGMVGLMEMLNGLNKSQPSFIQTMFATHPMSAERYQKVKAAAESRFATARHLPVHRERYMDETAGLRAIKKPIETMQKGEEALAKKAFGDAETLFRSALKGAPRDYTGLVLLSKSLLGQKKTQEALPYLEAAKTTYPQEAQAYHLAGLSKINLKRFDAAYEDFVAYERRLPGDPTTTFLKGYALEGMQNKSQAAVHYRQYLGSVEEGEFAQHARKRLVSWGYLK